MKSRLSVILLYTRKRNIKILNLSKISSYARNVARKIYKRHFYNNKLLDLKSRIDLKIWRRKSMYILVFEKDSTSISPSYPANNNKT